jgi:hypothetical protein
MNKLAIIIYTDVGSPASMARVMNALESAKEYKENGDPVTVIFDGAGTKWIPVLEDESHNLHQLYRTVRPDTRVCDYCAESFEVHDQVAEVDVDIIEEYDGHVSLRKRFEAGYDVVTI